MNAYNSNSKIIEYCKVIVQKISIISELGTYLLLLVCFTTQTELKGQSSFSGNKEIVPFEYDEIPVMVIIEGYNRFYLNAIYANNDLLYVNIEELFHALLIPCIKGQNGESITGVLKDETQMYSVDFITGQIKTGTKIIDAKDAILNVSGTFFLETSFFPEAFGMTLTFNFRALTLFLKSDFELPVIKQQRIDKMRLNISRLTGEEMVDTVLRRNYHMFRFGMVDWSVASYQTWESSTDNRFGLGVGAELLKGEANISVIHYTLYEFDKRQLDYLWRWVDNDKKLIKQAQVGKISNQSVSFINNPVIGVVIRNSPTTVRKATGFYTINELTEPNWTVELYLNNVMVDYTKADASGMFSFKVPIVYGYTTLKLMFYGPLGEERTEERSMNIPYTVLPAGEFEYSLAAGIVEDGNASQYGRGDVNYGVNRLLTIGGGVEYLSSITTGAYIPFVKATIQPFSKLLITGEYDYGVKTRGLIDFYFTKDALLGIDYAKYVKGQLATRFNALEERKVKLTSPFRIKRIIGFSRLDFSQFIYDPFNYYQTSLMVSSYYKQFSVNSATSANWVENREAYIITDLSMSYRFRKGYTIRPSARYDISGNMFRSYKVSLEKSIPKGHLTFIYDRNLLYNDHYLSFSFRYDLSFARTNVSVSRNAGKISTSQSAQGSLAFGSGNNYVHTSLNPSVGRGGISLYPFLDLNQNGVFDAGEPMVKLTNVKVSGSKAIFNEKDSIVRIPDLNSFTSYIIEFSDNDLENISWRFSKKVYKILIDPNQFKRVDIPIISVGEVSGTAYINRDNQLRGIGRILVKFYRKESADPVAEVLSEYDGYIYYLGLEPGEYYASIDSAQMAALGYTSDPGRVNFTIKPSIEGDIVDGVDFVLNDDKAKVVTISDSLSDKTVSEKIKMALLVDEHDTKKIADIRLYETDLDSIEIIVGQVDTVQKNQSVLVWGVLCEPIGSYYVQCGAFRNKSYALRMGLLIKEKTGLPVGVALHNGFYKVRVECMTSRSEIVEVMNELAIKKVTTEMFIVIRK